MRELHKAGGTKEDVIKALQVLPVVCFQSSTTLPLARNHLALEYTTLG